MPVSHTSLPADARLVILTGAGISAESGLKTFRDSNGLWENHRVEDVATPEAFARDPRLVWRFYNARREQLWRDAEHSVEPNAGHRALVRLAETLGPDRCFLVTQNVDDLHERAGHSDVCHMHGELIKVRCTECQQVTDTTETLMADDSAPLPTCQRCPGILRPHIVWFGEIPFEMELIARRLSHCTHFIAIGTSGVVYPAAGFLAQANRMGATTLGFSLDPPENVGLFDHFIQGPASQTLPEWVDAVLSRSH